MARPSRWRVPALVVLLVGPLLATASSSGAAFSGATGNPGDNWRADTLQPPTGLVVTPRCTVASTPTVVAAATSSANYTSPVLTVPAATQVGDLLLVHVVDAGTVFPPSGFQRLLVTPDATGTFEAGIYQRIATANDVGKTYVFAVSGNKGAGGLLVIRGSAGLLSATEAAGADSGITSSVVAPSVTTSVAGSLLVAFFAVDQSSASFLHPPGMTEPYDNAGSTGASDTADTEPRSSPGATGTRTATSSRAGTALGQSVVVRPASVSTADLTWNRSGSAYTQSYAVRRDGALVASVTPGSASGWTDPAPPAGTHTWTVTSASSSWRSAPASASATTTCP